MQNRFYRWGRGPLAPEEIDPDAYLRAPDSIHGHYFIEVLAEVNRLLPDRGLKFLLTWNLDRFVEEMRDSIVFLIGDEQYQAPAYASRVRAIFKTGGIRRNPLGQTLRLPFDVAWRVLLRDMRNVAVSVRHGFRSGGAAMFELPIGYYKQVVVPEVAFEARPADVCFAGTVVTKRQFSVRPAVAARRRMSQGMEAARAALPELRFEYIGGGEILGPEDYSRLLMNSKVVLCPRGNFDETFRLVEAARAGCVVVSEPLPPRWYNARAPVVTVRDWRTLPAVIEGLFADRAALARRAEEARGWWRDCLSPEAVARYVAARVSELA
jgi:hypothetical protein